LIQIKAAVLLGTGFSLIYINVHPGHWHKVQACRLTTPGNIQAGEHMNAPVEKVIGDVKLLAADVEELVKATAAQSGEKIAAARDRVQHALAGVTDTVSVRGAEAARATDRLVHENAWTAVGISAGVALLVGLLIGRR
jgi:ElaB/YqjD/DUF883 family membrane-anchored ribosome-binding protein